MSNNPTIYIPYFRDNKFVKPPEGYFILPGHICPDCRKNDKRYDMYSSFPNWEPTENTGTTKVTESNSFIYARPIKGNEELYGQMAFLPEQIVEPPEGYYLLPANINFEDGDIGYWKRSNEWKFEKCMMFSSNNGTPNKNYNVFKGDISTSAIAFARKIVTKVNYDELPNVVISNPTMDDRKAFIALANKYNLNPFGWGINILNDQPQILIVALQNKEIKKGLYSCYNYENYYKAYTYKAPFNWEEIENHIKYTVEKQKAMNNKVELDYAKWPNFQVYCETNEAVRDCVKLAISYKLSLDVHNQCEAKGIYILFTKKDGYSENKLEWNFTRYESEKYYTYPKFNFDKIKKHLEAVYPNMNVTNDNVDYAKFPNFAVKVDNDNTRVMLVALAEKYGFKNKQGCKAAYICVSRVVNSEAAGIIISSDGPYVNDPSNKYYIYKSPDWNAIIKHFEAPVVEVKKLPFVNGYTMEYNKDSKCGGGTVVTFGCANIPIVLLTALDLAINAGCMVGNRKVSSITLDSGKVITKEQIKEILEYVDWANKQ